MSSAVIKDYVVGFTCPVHSAVYFALPLAVSCLLLSGCGGDGLQRSVVSGTVTYRGDPVQDGQIRFVPQGNTAGPLTIEPITNGRYRCARSGGVPCGTHRVEIYSFAPATSPPAPFGPAATLAQREQTLPEKFNTNSQFTVTIAAESGDTVHDFTLE